MTITAANLLMGANFTGTKTGTVSDTKKGDGTFSVTKTVNENGSKTTDKSVTFADGTRTSSKTVIMNEDGSRTVQASKTDKDGNVTMTQKTLVTNEDGTISVTGTSTLASGMIVDISGTITKDEDGRVTDMTLTNADGKTRTSHRDVSYSEESGVKTRVADGTNYKGKETHRETNWIVTA